MMAHVQIITSCWFWMEHIMNNAYGRVRLLKPSAFNQSSSQRLTASNAKTAGKMVSNSIFPLFAVLPPAPCWHCEILRISQVMSHLSLQTCSRFQQTHPSMMLWILWYVHVHASQTLVAEYLVLILNIFKDIFFFDFAMQFIAACHPNFTTLDDEIDPINCQIACLKGCIGVCFLSLHFKMIYLRCKIKWLDRCFLLPMFVLNPSKNITTDICGCYICSEVRFRKTTVSGSGNSTLIFSSRMGLRLAFCCQAGCV